MAVIYVVEDDANIREIEMIALKNSGYEVEEFEYASDFFEALKPGGILFVGATEAILNFRRLGYTSYKPFFYQRPL